MLPVAAERKLRRCQSIPTADALQRQWPIPAAAATAMPMWIANPSNAPMTRNSMKTHTNTEYAAMQTDAAANTPAVAGTPSGPNLHIPDGFAAAICIMEKRRAVTATINPIAKSRSDCASAFCLVSLFHLKDNGAFAVDFAEKLWSAGNVQSAHIPWERFHRR